MIARILLGAALGATLSTAALAQSYNAPAGIPAATAPGGLEGMAASGNLQRYGQRLGHTNVGPITVDRVETTGSIRRTR